MQSQRRLPARSRSPPNALDANRAISISAGVTVRYSAGLDLKKARASLDELHVLTTSFETASNRQRPVALDQIYPH